MTATPSAAAGPTDLFALLIGIDRYLVPEVPSLRGAVADVEAMRLFLVNQMGVADPDRQIRVLTNAQATREAILDGFQNFLTNNPAIAPGSQILIHYSGHGSTAPSRDPGEPDGLDETIVPYDSRQGDVFDLSDKMLAALIQRLAEAKGPHIAVVLDSCHAGSGTRDSAAPRARRIPQDTRMPPPELDAAMSASTPRTRGLANEDATASALRYVLLAACRDRELANELRAEDGVWHGALTYFLLDALRTLPPGTPYRDLMAGVAAQVNGVYRDQMPQCEGQRDRVVFGGAQVQRDPFVLVKSVSDSDLVLAAGLVHGLQPGTRLAAYPSTVRTRAELPAAPLATLKVTSVTATTATAEIEPGATGTIVPLSWAVVVEAVYGGARLGVTVSADVDGSARATADVSMGADGSARARVDADADGNLAATTRSIVTGLEAAIRSSPFLQLLDRSPRGSSPAPASPRQATTGQITAVESDASPDLRVLVNGSRVTIQNADQTTLVAPADFAGAGAGDPVRTAAHALDAIGRYRAVQGLHNRGASTLAGKFALRLRRFAPDIAPEAMPIVEPTDGGEILLPYDSEDGSPDANRYVVEVVNTSGRAVYVSLFYLNPDFSIVRLYPRAGQQEALAPRSSVSIGLGASGEPPFSVYLPDEPYWESSRDQLKIIATTRYADLEVVEQAPLDVPPPIAVNRGGRTALDRLLGAVLSGTRSGSPLGGGSTEDWTTAELVFGVVRSGSRSAAGGED